MSTKGALPSCPLPVMTSTVQYHRQWVTISLSPAPAFFVSLLANCNCIDCDECELNWLDVNVLSFEDLLCVQLDENRMVTWTGLIGLVCVMSGNCEWMSSEINN